MSLYYGRDQRDSAAFLERARSLVLVCDLEGRDRIERLLDAATERQIPVSFSVIGGCQTDRCEVDTLHRTGALLRDQQMGTRVAVAVGTGLMERVESILEAAGLTNEEVWVESQGVHAHPVFCAACYHENPATRERYIQCEKCQRVLEVSKHYSPRLHSVMGYVSLPEQRQDEQGADGRTCDAKL